MRFLGVSQLLRRRIWRVRRIELTKILFRRFKDIRNKCRVHLKVWSIINFSNDIRLAIISSATSHPNVFGAFHATRILCRWVSTWVAFAKIASTTFDKRNTARLTHNSWRSGGPAFIGRYPSTITLLLQEAWNATVFCYKPVGIFSRTLIILNMGRFSCSNEDILMQDNYSLTVPNLIKEARNEDIKIEVKEMASKLRFINPPREECLSFIGNKVLIEMVKRTTNCRCTYYRLSTSREKKYMNYLTHSIRVPRFNWCELPAKFSVSG